VALLRDEVHSTSKDGREVVVRSATPRDARALTRLLDEIAAEPEVFLLLRPGEFSARDWKKRLAEATADPGALALLAFVAGELAGNLALRPDPHRNSAHVGVVGMSVAGVQRGIGVGTALLDAALAWAADHAVSKVELSVFPHNQAAQRFYEARGFTVEGVRRAHFVRAGHALDEILMGRLLEPAT